MSTFPFKKAAFAVTAAGVLFVTGCSAPSASSPASSSAPAPESTSASAAPTSTETAAAATAVSPPAGAMPAGAGIGSYDDRLAIGSSVIKAGETLHVYGGTLEPGSTVKVYGAQQMAMPSYDAATDTYTQVGEEVKLTDQVSATVGPKGTYDIQLPIPAGTAPQLVNIVMLSSDGRGDLVQTTVE